MKQKLYTAWLVLFFLLICPMSISWAVLDYNIKNGAQSRLFVNGTSGNVGINSANPQAKLDVEGGVYFGNGNVGIGSAFPNAKLVVSGGDIMLDNSRSIKFWNGRATPSLQTVLTLNVNNIVSLGGNSDASAVYFYAGNDSTGEFYFYRGGTKYVTISAEGNLLLHVGNMGVGTTVPYGKLEVDGTLYFPTTAKGNIGIGSVAPRGAIDVDGDIYGISFYGDGSTLSGVATTGNLTANYVPKKDISGVMVDSNIYDDGINVGIGSSNPRAKLDVVGTVNLNNNNISISSTEVTIDLLY